MIIFWVLTLVCIRINKALVIKPNIARPPSSFTSTSTSTTLHSSSSSSSSLFDGFKSPNFLEKLKNSINPPLINKNDFVNDNSVNRPWRKKRMGPKIQYLPWKDSWRERYRDVQNDDTIYLYTIPTYKLPADQTRVEEIWSFPWLWTKIKAERLSWIYKYFLTNVESLSVQEHMEMDAFFSEYDMPYRWGMLRMKELDVLNVFALNLVFWTDFNGIKPTDLGIRSDNTLKTCAVQFHNCISSSNDPRDIDHYAPPFQWSRSKSPDQAYDEIKNIYLNYPKRGLKWSSGWIDRGGWKPQQFNGPYFYAQADSLAFRFTDDIELLINNEKREVQYRSSSRIGQHDFDVQRLRYNQFARMLSSKGGWEGLKPLERQHFVRNTPFRWTQIAMNKIYNTISNFLNKYFNINILNAESDNRNNIANKYMNNVLEVVNNVVKVLGLDKQMSEINEYFINLKGVIENNYYIKNFDSIIQKLLFDTSSGKDDVTIMQNEQLQQQVVDDGDLIIENEDISMPLETTVPSQTSSQETYIYPNPAVDPDSNSYLRSTEEADDDIEEINESEIERFVRYMDEKRRDKRVHNLQNFVL